MFQIPGLPYVNPLLGNMRFLLTGEAMEASIKYEMFISNSVQQMGYHKVLAWKDLPFNIDIVCLLNRSSNIIVTRAVVDRSMHRAVGFLTQARATKLGS